jgi:hypothetical protein
MNKVRQIRILSVVLIVAFLATSTVARAMASEATGESDYSFFLHAKADTPYSGDHQFPFEEKEKEFEDKSESENDKNDTFESNFTFICDVCSSTPAESFDTSSNFYFNNPGLLSAGVQVPLFLSNRTILI